jgi:hypothetical protein
MKILLNSIFLLIISFSSFSQKSKKENLNLIFFDKCTNHFVQPEIKFDTITGLKNGRVITYYIKRGNWISQALTSTIINRKKTDTITVPKILFSLGNEVNSKRWIYLNCENPCNGIEVDFFKNGNKRIEGKFDKGKPIELKKYRENGKIFSHAFYKNLEINFKQINYFKQNGEIFEFEIYTLKNGVTEIKTFNNNNILINREIQENYIEPAYEY